MNRKVAFGLFIVLATLGNVVAVAVFFFGILALWGALIAPLVKLPASGLVIMLAFVVAIALATVVYRAVLNAIGKRCNFDEKFGLKN